MKTLLSGGECSHCNRFMESRMPRMVDPARLAITPAERERLMAEGLIRQYRGPKERPARRARPYKSRALSPRQLEKVMRWRTEFGWSQAEIAKALGVGSSCIFYALKCMGAPVFRASYKSKKPARP